jgi:transcriptional regulator with XRE-family HTH domain
MRRISPQERQARQVRGARIALALEQAGLSQRLLAQRLSSDRRAAGKVSQSYVAQLIAGTCRGTDGQIREIARLAGVPREFIEHGTGWAPPLRPGESLRKGAVARKLVLDRRVWTRIRSGCQGAVLLSKEQEAVLRAEIRKEPSGRMPEGTALIVLVVR